MEETKSKSQLKREMKQLQSLGEELVGLRREQLAELPLDTSLRQAIEQAQGIKAHGGRKRQLKFIGKLLRQRDAAAIADALQPRRERRVLATAHFHRLERWRDRLLEEGDTAVESLLRDYPQADRQQLRTLLRNAARESAAGRPPTAARRLFRYLRELTSDSRQGR